MLSQLVYGNSAARMFAFVYLALMHMLVFTSLMRMTHHSSQQLYTHSQVSGEGVRNKGGTGYRELDPHHLVCSTETYYSTCKVTVVVLDLFGTTLSAAALKRLVVSCTASSHYMDTARLAEACWPRRALLYMGVGSTSSSCLSQMPRAPA